MNDNSLPKPSQTPTFTPPSNVVSSSTPVPNLGSAPGISPSSPLSPTTSQQPSVPGFIPSTSPISSPSLPKSPISPAPSGMTPTQPTQSVPVAASPSPGLGVPSTPMADAKNPTPPAAVARFGRPLVGQPSPKPSVVPPTVNTSAQAKPVTPPPTAPSAPPNLAKPQKSILRFLPFVLIGVGLLAVVGFIGYWFFSRQTNDQAATPTTQVPQQKTEVQYWGLWEPTEVMDQVISDFEAQNPSVHIVYTQQSHQEYRERLQTAIATGAGPDVFRFHASWVPMLRSELAPLPEKIMSAAEYDQTFYPVATTQLTSNGERVGIPLMYDGLGLYYNKQIFNIANENPPQNWEDVKRLASELTVRDGGKITRAGIALGTTSNIEHHSDILGLMMFQNGADPLQPNSPKGQEALSFYTSFSKTLKVWDDTLPMATTAFARGDVVMMLAPSWRVHEIKAKNPNLEFGIVPVPQLDDTPRTAWASFWAEGVSTQSKNKEAAWIFLKYLSSSEVQKKLYSDAKKIRAFGEIYSRVDLASSIVQDDYVGAYLQDAAYARTSYTNAYTHDNGINDRISKYYLDAINQSNLGTQADKVLETASQGIQQILQQYGFQAASPS